MTEPLVLEGELTLELYPIDLNYYLYLDGQPIEDHVRGVLELTSDWSYGRVRITIERVEDTD